MTHLRRARTLCLALFAMLTTVPILGESSSLNTSEKENALRAAVVFGILKYTEWPESVLAKQSIAICGLGIAGAAQVFSQQKDKLPDLAGNKLTFTDISTLQQFDAANCDVVLIGKEHQLPTQLIHSSVMSICDNCDSHLEKETTINLIRKNNRIQFEVNLDSAFQHGLEFRSALLELALSCRSSKDSYRGCQP